MILTKTFLKKLNKNLTVTIESLSIDDLEKIIHESSKAYYNKGESLISDEIFDLIKDKLKQLDPNNKVLKEVGAAIDAKKKVQLPCYMGSLDKIKTDIKVLEKWQEKYPGQVVISDKLDGNSGLYHKIDNTIKLYTRGDGTYGQNITNLLEYVKNIPNINDNEDITVRGEFIISKKDFPKIIREKKLANARNAVAGVLNAKRPDIEIAKYVKFIAYELISPKMIPSLSLQFLKNNGFEVVNHNIKTDYNVEILSKLLEKRRHDGEYEIDGLVVAHDLLHKITTKENPKYAFAFKNALTLDKAEVMVLNVEWNSSKDGYLKPTVLFEPIKLDGVTIQKATGFNAKFINDNKIGPGAVIIIVRAGQVIPHISEVLKPANEAQMPDCDYTWNKTKVDIIADTITDAQDIQSIVYFFSKLDVKGLAEGNITKMYNSGLNTVGKIIHADKTTLAKVDTFKEKMVDNIHSTLSSIKLPCIDIMDGSNTLGRGIGKKKIEPIIEALPQIISKKYIPNIEELTAIKGISDITAQSIISGLPKYWKFIDDNDLQCLFKKEEETKNTLIENLFKDEKVVLTGFRDKNIEQYIKDQGGEVVGSVSSKTTLIIAKDPNEDSSKLSKARELNIKIISKDDFTKTYM